MEHWQAAVGMLVQAGVGLVLGQAAVGSGEQAEVRLVLGPAAVPRAKDHWQAVGLVEQAEVGLVEQAEVGLVEQAAAVLLVDLLLLDLNRERVYRVQQRRRGHR
jgi:hypothetical protein